MFTPERHLPTSGQHGPAPSGTPLPAQPPPPPQTRETQSHSAPTPLKRPMLTPEGGLRRVNPTRAPVRPSEWAYPGSPPGGCVPLGQAQIQVAGIVRRVASRRGSTLALPTHPTPTPSTTTTVCSLRMMTPPLTLTTYDSNADCLRRRRALSTGGHSTS